MKTRVIRIYITRDIWKLFPIPLAFFEAYQRCNQPPSKVTQEILNVGRGVVQSWHGCYHFCFQYFLKYSLWMVFDIPQRHRAMQSVMSLSVSWQCLPVGPHDAVKSKIHILPLLTRESPEDQIARLDHGGSWYPIWNLDLFSELMSFLHVILFKRIFKYHSSRSRNLKPSLWTGMEQCLTFALTSSADSNGTCTGLLSLNGWY